MKRLFSLFFLLILLMSGGMTFKMDKDKAPVQADTANNLKADENRMSNRLNIKIGSRTISATLLNNVTVTAFKKQLPLTLSMKDLNTNEKFADLPNSLPTNSVNPGTIQMGDLMLYGANTLVLFYKPFPTAYSYTKLGQIDNLEGLAAALGSGNITALFELE